MTFDYMGARVRACSCNPRDSSTPATRGSWCVHQKRPGVTQAVPPGNSVAAEILEVSGWLDEAPPTVFDIPRALLGAVLSSLRTRRELALENLALRQQIGVLRRSVKRPRLTNADRAFWVLLRRWWSGWDRVLTVVQPATVIRWHRRGFRAYWRWRSRRRAGRPALGAEIRFPWDTAPRYMLRDRDGNYGAEFRRRIRA